MPSYSVDIDNTFGQSFRISLEISFNVNAAGKWKTWHNGYIRHDSGWIYHEPSSGTLTTFHLLLHNSEDTWGIRLNDFTDFWGANDEGDGLLLQNWSLSFKPGVIYWKVIEGKGGEF